MSYAAFISSSQSFPSRRKVHIGDEDAGGSLCGIERRVPWLLWSFAANYHDIESQFFIDPDGEGCKRCGAIYRQTEAAATQRERLKAGPNGTTT